MSDKTSIFLSRPTWVADEFRPGLQAFLRLLEHLGLMPRTIGQSDAAIESPMAEVIALMNKCSGAIILGYPQVLIQAGAIKDTALTQPMWLPTEWNHIEAALACARRLPILMIHHSGVGRGVFDRGAVSSFVYEIDLTSAGWPLEARVSGAITHWKEKLLVSADVLTKKSDDAIRKLSGLYLRDKDGSDAVNMIDAMRDLQGMWPSLDLVDTRFEV